MADFIHKNLGHQKRGSVVEITLSSGTNVRLLDPTNFSSYRRGQKHRYVGGRATKSPVRLGIPRTGHWHVVVDRQGLRGGNVRAGFRVISAAARQPLPAIRQGGSPVAEIAENYAAATITGGFDERSFDVFISHATEDKDELVRPLALALRARGLDVWYDEFEMRIGDSLRRKIDNGIANSRFGLVVFSPAFFAKHWTQHELDGLVTLSVTGDQVLLPIWHNISKDAVVRESPSLADKVALRTSDYSVDEIANEIAVVVGATSDDALAQ